jgi:epoxyqueuosine reductase QueG
MGNSGNTALIPVLEKMSADADSVVSEHAQWALQKLRTQIESKEM